MQTGGFIIADNVLWSGKVVEEVNDKDQETKALKNSIPLFKLQKE